MEQGDSKFRISVKGRLVEVPAIRVGARTVVVSGGWLRIASVFDDEWLEGEAVDDPDRFLEAIRRSDLKADLFTFAQAIPNTEPRYRYPMEWDNVAAIATSDYEDWWLNRVPQETRKNVRRAGRRGIVVRELQFDNQLVEGIVKINNETPVRQGRPFWHYQKSVDEVKCDYAGFNERSQYIGAYSGEELVGFVKMVYMGTSAGILQLLCMNKHQDKRPANALLCRAVEICNARGLQYLIYGKYSYGKSADSLLTEFKRRNGFQQILLPRYYIPINARGGLAFRCGLHRGVKSLLPPSVLEKAKRLRAFWYRKSRSVDSVDG